MPESYVAGESAAFDELTVIRTALSRNGSWAAVVCGLTQNCAGEFVHVGRVWRLVGDFGLRAGLDT